MARPTLANETGFGFGFSGAPIHPVKRPGHPKTILEAIGALRRCPPVTHASPQTVPRLWESRPNNGAGEGIRTLDPDLGKVVLYP
jgi:hypothetical protein